MRGNLRVLLTNDDGFWAPGLQALAAAMRRIASEVLIVAPSTEQSGRGHAITMNEPIRFRKEHEHGALVGYSVNGTPADCVKVAIRYLMDRQPDVVFSGINHGRNTGMNVLYSGTVAGAMEAAMYNIPAAAISVASDRGFADFQPSADIAVRLAPILPELGLPHGVMLNVNVPPLPAEQIKGVALGKQSEFRFLDLFEERRDPRGNIYFWLNGERMVLAEQGAVDEVLVNEGKIAITPLRGDLTDYDWMRRLGDLDLSRMLD